MADDDKSMAQARGKIIVIGDEATTLGFRLTGVHKHVLIGDGDQKAFDEAVESALDSSIYSVIIADQGMLLGVGAKLSRRLQDTVVPLVVGIPNKRGAADGEQSLDELMKRVLGIELKVGD